MQLTDSKGGNKLRESDEEEIQVEEELELFVQHERKEGDDVVFLVSDEVRGVL